MLNNCNEYFHGMSGAQIYNIWIHAKNLARNNGKLIYEPWENDFEAFYTYMKSIGWKDDQDTIETKIRARRIDKSIGWQPGNIEIIKQKNNSFKIITDGDRIGIRYKGKWYTVEEFESYINELGIEL